ncbi:PREDICTED: mitochondrial inner membrane protein COX18 isoform X2 [Wasmannia auropunctata]|uniref:mitochondrial inner membrane protein COX18 isoform X2 n=1 Tax=Wasmannia auropunctata TaxID=64793 RepID=UPI0005ED75C0|nr:PREDICTED: mitochondrial inner membrane protein COX18 isoform X2 [Wasmannia auropunctata]
MKIKNLDVFLKRLKGVSKIANRNATCFNVTSTASSYTVCNDYSTSRTHIAQDLTFNNHQSMLNNVSNVTVKCSSRIQNNFLCVSYPRIISHIILYNGKKHVKCKTYHSSQYFNSVRYISNVGVDSIAEAQVPTQFNGVFKVISESAPVKLTQDSLLLVHDYTGLPWWSVIILATIIMRTTVTLPLSLYQMKKQWNKLIVRENCHPAKASLLILVQVPLWISLSMSIRNFCYMLPKQDAGAYTTYQEFSTDGFLWISNLTIPDSFVLPIAMGLFNLAIIEITCMSRVKELTKWQRYLTIFMRIVTIGMVPIAMSVPSCLSLYWATSSAFGLFQNLILLSPNLRRFVKVPITTSESPHPYLVLRNRIAARCHFESKVENPPKI